LSEEFNLKKVGGAFHEHFERCRTLGQTMIGGYLGVDWTIDPIATRAVNGKSNTEGAWIQV
jgi:hypothetical protein